MDKFVEEFEIGNTKVKISDEYCRDKTEEDVKDILNRIARGALPCIANDNKQGKAG